MTPTPREDDVRKMPFDPVPDYVPSYASELGEKKERLTQFMKEKSVARLNCVNIGKPNTTRLGELESGETFRYAGSADPNNVYMVIGLDNLDAGELPTDHVAYIGLRSGRIYSSRASRSVIKVAATLQFADEP